MKALYSSWGTVYGRRQVRRKQLLGDSDNNMSLIYNCSNKNESCKHHFIGNLNCTWYGIINLFWLKIPFHYNYQVYNYRHYSDLSTSSITGRIFSFMFGVLEQICIKTYYYHLVCYMIWPWHYHPPTYPMETRLVVKKPGAGT